MRILVQRVFEAWVRVAGAEISRTKQGLLVLVGITHDDNTDVADHMVSKILNMRLWDKDGKNWNGSVMEINGDIMVVSQFTLYGILKGNKPDFHSSMEAEKAKELFNYLVNQLNEKYQKERIQTGRFQALMQVGTIINGPVTIQYEKSASDMPKKKGKVWPQSKKEELGEKISLEKKEDQKQQKKEQKKEQKSEKQTKKQGQN